MPRDLRGENVWALEKYIMMEVFDPSGLSESAASRIDTVLGASLSRRPSVWEAPVKEARRSKALKNVNLNVVYIVVVPDRLSLSLSVSLIQLLYNDFRK